MATRFATASGNWSNTAIWDGGTLPTSSDTVHPNGFTVTIDQDITIDGFNNNISPVYLPGMPIPKMTGNTLPSGTVIAGSDTSNAWKAFDQDAAAPVTFWAGTGVGSGTAWVGYNFTAAKTIKRYYIYRVSQNPKPTSWTFDGSNDGSTWTTLETVTANALNTPYLSGVLANTTAYLYYRINVTAVTSGTIANIYQFEMTESTGTTYGSITGGSFTVPSSLSGTRNIVQTGAGIISNNSATVLTLAHIAGNTVNMNVSSGGYIFNQNSVNAATNNLNVININGTGITNFNGDIWGTQTTGSYLNTGAMIGINNGCTINIFGNIYGCRGTVGSTSNVIRAYSGVSNAAIINITGNLISSGITNAADMLNNLSIATFNIIGNLTSDLSKVYDTTTPAILNVTGTVSVTNVNSVPTIYSIGIGLITIRGIIINKSNTNSVIALKLRFNTTTAPSWTFQDTTGTDFVLGYNTTGAYPVEADVRFGTTYAASPTRTGTLRVPLPQYVSQGVLTDNTTGTAYLSATDVWNIQTSTLTTAGSIGERLKTASTVQTNGDQLASYIV